MAKPKDFKKILYGKTLRGNLYKITFTIKNNKVEDIAYGDNININIKDAIEYMKQKKTSYVNNAIELIKMKMYSLNEFMKDEELLG